MTMRKLNCKPGDVLRCPEFNAYAIVAGRKNNTNFEEAYSIDGWRVDGEDWEYTDCTDTWVQIDPGDYIARGYEADVVLADWTARILVKGY